MTWWILDTHCFDFSYKQFLALEVGSEDAQKNLKNSNCFTIRHAFLTEEPKISSLNWEGPGKLLIYFTLTG